MVANKLIGFLGDVHIYHNHLEQVNVQLEREEYKTPVLKLGKYTSIFDWQWSDAELEGYVCHPPIKAPVAI